MITSEMRCSRNCDNMTAFPGLEKSLNADILNLSLSEPAEYIIYMYLGSL
jgi:hypothetical protein